MKTLTLQLHNQKGASAGKVEVSEAVFGQTLNRDLVHQVMLAMRANQRMSTADVKDRSEVRGGGKKPWRQKGTGRARHGSRRSPIWVGGGVTHGPTSEKDYSQKVNRKMKAKALCSALSEKMRNGQIIFLDALTVESGKTKDAEVVMQALAGIKGFETLNTRKNPNNVRIILADKHDETERALKNLPHVQIEEGRNLNVLDVLDSRYLVIVDPKQLDDMLGNRLAVTRAPLSETAEAAA